MTKLEAAAEAVAKQSLFVETLAESNVAHLNAEQRIKSRADYELERARLEAMRDNLREMIARDRQLADYQRAGLIGPRSIDPGYLDTSRISPHDWMGKA